MATPIVDLEDFDEFPELLQAAIVTMVPDLEPHEEGCLTQSNPKADGASGTKGNPDYGSASASHNLGNGQISTSASTNSGSGTDGRVRAAAWVDEEGVSVTASTDVRVVTHQSGSATASWANSGGGGQTAGTANAVATARVLILALTDDGLRVLASGGIGVSSPPSPGSPGSQSANLPSRYTGVVTLEAGAEHWPYFKVYSAASKTGPATAGASSSMTAGDVTWCTQAKVDLDP